MNDTDRMTQLLTARHPCVTMLTYEESEAIGVVRGRRRQGGLELLEWSVSSGLKDGARRGGAVVPNTEHPAAALATFAAARSAWSSPSATSPLI
jgi:hypothetical protein